MKTAKNSKRALLCSALSIALCLSMLIGTTFAWFTDTASASVSKITSGNLHVEIQNEAGSKLTSLNWVKADGHTEEAVLWEPGCTYTLTPFKIVNTGNLALKYKMVITGLDGNAELLDVIHFTYKLGNAELNLDEEGHLTAAGTEGAATGLITVSATMDKTAGNEYMNKSLEGVEIKVYATQDAHEYDSESNTYDEAAPLDFVPVSSTEEFKSVFKDAKAGETINVSLNSDVEISNNELSVINETQSGIGVGVGDININANGHTIKTSNSGTRIVKIECSDTPRNITISDAKIVSESTVGNTSENRGIQIFSVNNATINLVNCEIEMKSNDYSYPVKIGGTSENLTLNITGCTLTGANCIESYGKNCTVNITDCVFNSNYAPNATYCGQGIQDKNGTNNTYNIKNTTFNGTNAQPWQTSATTTINDLGGNVNNTTKTSA